MRRFNLQFLSNDMLCVTLAVRGIVASSCGNFRNSETPMVPMMPTVETQAATPLLLDLVVGEMDLTKRSLESEFCPMTLHEPDDAA
jgi:hypothetical protein